MKVQITYCDKQVLVDEDQVKILSKKDALFQRAKALRKEEKATGEYDHELSEIASKMMSLNRRIRKNVQFINV